MCSRLDTRRGVRPANDWDLYVLVRRVMKNRFCDATDLKDVDTAARLGITLDQLAVLHTRMNSRGLMRCRAKLTRTKYRFEPRTMKDYE
jgi:hypothetical protein